MTFPTISELILNDWRMEAGGEDHYPHLAYIGRIPPEPDPTCAECGDRFDPEDPDDRTCRPCTNYEGPNQ